MLNCGTIKRQNVAATPDLRFFGEVKLARRINGYVSLYDNPRWKQGEDNNAPRYIVGYKPFTWRGPEMIIGKAWEKHAERSNVDFLSLTLDDPDWSSPLTVHAFVSDDRPGEMDVVWSRPRRNEDKEAA